MQITKEIIFDHLELFKQNAKKSFQSKQFSNAIKYLECFARLAYQYNLFYTDDDAENLIDELGNALIGKINIDKDKNKILFYDSFALDNRGLTQQYLRAIFSWGSELLFITNAKTIGKDILSELNSYPNARILKFRNGDIEDYRIVINEIKGFCPEKILMHLSPWDISGLLVLNALKNTDRFLINLTDHAFWLGRKCSDYVLEFRGYGAKVSVEKRKIEPDKLILQPYYPILNKYEFKGFPFKTDKIIAFAGGSLYKISGRNNLFLETIKEALLKNDQFVFVLAGHGDKKIIHKFIRYNRLEGRFFVLGDRKDLSAVFENIDIYINTYPIIGGLMTQYAAIHNKPIIGFSTPDLFAINDTEDILQVANNKVLIKLSKGDFINYLHKLIIDKEERKKNVEITKGSVISFEDFNKRLFRNLYIHENKIALKSYVAINIDYNAISDLYLEMENQYVHLHYTIIFDLLKFRAFKHFPIIGVGVIYKKYYQKGLTKLIRKIKLKP